MSTLMDKHQNQLGLERFDSSKGPVFLVGAERSGTTLLRLMLDHHPEIAFASEFEFVVDHIDANGVPPTMAQYCELLSINRGFLDANLEIDRSLSYWDLVRSFLVQRNAKANSTIIGSTLHRNFDRLLFAWPNARFIHLVRDPRDVARSVIAMGWAGNVWHAVSEWIDAEICWQTMEQTLPANSKHTLHYEDLLQNPEKELTDICKFMGLPFRSEMLDYPKNSTYELPDIKLAYQWKHKLSENEIRLVESRAGEHLERLGYPASGLPELKVNAIRRRILSIQNYFFRTNFRFKRYGFALTFLLFATRRLRMNALLNHFTLRAHSIDRKFLR